MNINDPLWRLAAETRAKYAVFSLLGFLAGVMFTFAACTPDIPKSECPSQVTCAVPR
jgi:hypothetical protein